MTRINVVVCEETLYRAKRQYEQSFEKPSMAESRECIYVRVIKMMIDF